MYANDRVLALIPARGGSKGLPGKNVLPLAGRPLIAWTIDAALGSDFIDRVVVSTDDKRIGEVALAAGADVPFPRPASLATDDASTVDVVIQVLDELAASGELYDLIVLLQPTSPLRTTVDIDSALNLLGERGAESVIGVCENKHPLEWSAPLGEGGSMSQFPSSGASRRQEAVPTYRVNGAIYVTRTSALREHEGFLGPGALAYVMPPERSVDIDTELDLALAELLMVNRPR